MKEPKQTSKWKLRWFRVKMTESVREKKKKEEKLGEARHTGEGQSISDGEANNGIVVSVERGWVTLLEMWVIVEYVRLPPAACKSSVDDMKPDFLAVKNTRRDYRRAFRESFDRD